MKLSKCTHANNLLNIESLCQLGGAVQIYFADLKNVIINCNETEFVTLNEVFGVDKHDVIGNLTTDILKLKCSDTLVNTVLGENEAVIKSRKAQQFHNIWLAKGAYVAELLTIKTPTYTNRGKLTGVLGISYYINKFSFKAASRLGLSNKECECLIYILEGKINKQIAGLLDISVRTVEDYVDNIKRKLGCFSKADLIFKATQLQLTTGFNNSLGIKSMHGTDDNLILLNQIFFPASTHPLRKWPEKINLTTAETLIQKESVTLHKL